MKSFISPIITSDGLPEITPRNDWRWYLIARLKGYDIMYIFYMQRIRADGKDYYDTFYKLQAIRCSNHTEAWIEMNESEIPPKYDKLDYLRCMLHKEQPDFYKRNLKRWAKPKAPVG